MQLISYVKTATNKWLLISESHGDSNRCTSCRGKLDQHATRISRLVCVWPSTRWISRCPLITTFHESSTALNGYYCSWKKCFRLHLSARLSGPQDPLCASRPSRYVSVINDNHLISLMNLNAAKVNWGPYIKTHQQLESKWSIHED
jgi:hypothetical protein